jgi:putative Mn2+ efflux pump MntP
MNAQTPRRPRPDSIIALSIMFFAFAILCFMLGWADGVRHQREIFHIHQTASWLGGSVILIVIGAACLIWSRSLKR